MAQKILLLLALLAAGCAAFSGRERHTGAPIVTVEHNHRGACGPGGCLRQLWIRNGSSRDIVVDVVCANGTEWPTYVLPAGEDQGFAEWYGECHASVRDADDIR